MGDDTKQQLDKELALLTESHEQGIISNDEFEKQRQRIEKSISDLKNAAPTQENPEGILSGEKDVVVKELDSKELMVKEASSDIIKKAEEQKREEEELLSKVKVPVKAEKEEKPSKKKPSKKKTEKAKEAAQETVDKPDAQERREDKTEAKKQEPKPELKEETVIKDMHDNHQEKKPKKHIFLLILALISLVIAGYYYFSLDQPTSTLMKQEPNPACSHDSDCYKEYMFGSCTNPDTKDAYCEFKEDAHVKLTVLNDKNCKLCTTETTIGIVQGLFPNLEVIPVDISSAEGKALAKSLEIGSLPAYILDSNVANASNYNKFRQALIEEKGAFIVKPKAAGSAYYFNEVPVKNRLEMITLGNDAAASKAIANIGEFLEAFEGKVDFVHISNPQKSILRKYDIATFPVFIVNSQYKFSGILPANIVKEKFCAVNQMKECSADLSASLK